MTALVTRMLGLAVTASLILGQAAATEAQAGPAKSETRVWLEKAEEAANRIDNTKDGGTLSGPKARALALVAVTYVDLGETNEGKAIATRLPERERRSVLSWVPISLAHAGRFDEAVREAEAVNDPSCLAVVCAVIAKKDAPRALALADRVPESKRNWVYEQITESRVLAGDLKGAESAADRIKDAKGKERTSRWLTAGRFVQGGKDGAGAAIDPATIEEELCSIAETKSEAGDLKKAEQILTALRQPDCRCGVYISVAELYLKRNQKKEFQEAIGQALKEASAIDDPVMGALQRVARYVKIAQLQVKAGDFDEAMKTVGMADESGKEETKQWQDLGIESGGVFEGTGGRKTLIGLLLLAGKIDEAVKMATKEDGTLLPDAVPLLVEAYAVRGMSQELAALLKSAQSPEVEVALYLSAARGAAHKAKEASQE